MRLDAGEIGRRVRRAVLDACEPGRAVGRAWPGELDSAERVVLIAAGKASVGMARAAAERLGGRLARGLVVGPGEVVAGWEGPPTGLELLSGDHPIPTARNVAAAERAMAVAGGVGGGETLLVLISGGASTYLTAPSEGVTLDELARVTSALLRAGATIGELNAVRKHCERLKGGGLAREAGGAGGVWTLVVSDVLGDPIDVIGSGPTAGDPTTFADALRVLERGGVGAVAPAVRARLGRGAAGEIAETVKPGDPVVERVRHVVAANNALAVGAAAGAMRAIGFEIVETRTGVEGEAADAGMGLGVLLRGTGRGGCRVWGGETTVSVGGAPGVGGPVQEAVLSAAVEIEGVEGAGVLGLATDGVDGPTDAAGAVVDWRTSASIRGGEIDPVDALGRHDAHTALDSVGALTRTGPTGTNVNDVLVGFRGPV